MTNPTAGAEATRAAQEPLGSMLVRRGLLTAEQLEYITSWETGT